nr:hypothetical protein [uncultured Brevundimonas sp.]
MSLFLACRFAEAAAFLHRHAGVVIVLTLLAFAAAVIAPALAVVWRSGMG